MFECWCAAQNWKKSFEKVVKEHMTKYTLIELENTKDRDSCKINNIRHSQLGKPQLCSMISHKPSKKLKILLLSQKSKCVNGFMDNIYGQYSKYECALCWKPIDSQDNETACEAVSKS